MSVTAVDTNILFASLIPSADGHARAREFLNAQATNPDFVIPELCLVELYVLLRNPAVVARPLDAAAAGEIVGRFRRHPRWRLEDHDPAIMDELWQRMSQPGVARGRVFDLRLALGLLRRGVTHLATRNTRDFAGLGFESIFDPLA